MFLNNIRRLLQTLALRMTIWYAAIFAVSSILVFVFVYLLISELSDISWRFNKFFSAS